MRLQPARLLRSLLALPLCLATLSAIAPAFWNPVAACWNPAAGEWDPQAGQWGKVAPEDVRVMSWNVRDMLCSTNAKLEGQNNWCASARIVAALRPDVLVLQECGDNSGNGTGTGADSVAQLLITIELFFAGGNDPFNGGTVSSYVQKYAPGYDLAYRYVSSETDGFNRNVVLSRWPFQDLNGDGRSVYADIPDVSPDQYAPGGDGGLRGFQFVEIGLPDDVYLGDLVVGSAHLKAGSSNSDHLQRTTAARNVAYVVDYWYNGAGTGIPDPNDKIADFPPATSILADATPVILAGDWNEEEGSDWAKGPAGWLTRAELTGGTDGTDRDRSDMFFDDARHPFTNDGDTLGSRKLDYIAWQDSIAGERLGFIFDTQGTPFPSFPLELLGMPDPQSASSVASDHLPVIVDFELPLVCGQVPFNYCIGAPNSISGGATMYASGTTSIAANDFKLHVQSARPGQFGLFFYGPQQTEVPYGDGYRCVATGGLGIFRLHPPLTADPFGDAERLLDFSQPPAGAGPGAVMPGSTWYFQFWYRDPGGPGGSGFNFSDGLGASFCG